MSSVDERFYKRSNYSLAYCVAVCPGRGRLTDVIALSSVHCMISYSQGVEPFEIKQSRVYLLFNPAGRQQFF